MDENAIRPRTDDSTKIPKRMPGDTLHRYFSLMREVDDTHGRCVITFDGKVNTRRMARAVRLTLDAYPILGCQFIEHPWRPYWERRDDLDRIRTFSVVVPSDLNHELGHFMGAPLDPAEDSQVQTCLFRCEQDMLCIKINHMIADAGGLLEYASLLATTYRQLDHNPEYVPAPRLGARGGQAEVLRQVSLSNVIRACRHFSLPPATWDPRAPTRDLHECKFLVRRVVPERLATVKDYAHHCGIPLNHVLLATFYRALFDVIDPPTGVPLPTQVTVSLRRYLKPDPSRPISNLVGAFFPRVIRMPNAGFEDTLAQVHAVMQAADKSQPWLGQALLAELAFSPPYAMVHWIAHRVMTQQSGPPNFPPIYANLGVIDPAQVDFGDIRVADVAMLGPVPNPPACLLTVNTFRETMVLTTGFRDTTDETRRAQALLDAYIDALPS